MLLCSRRPGDRTAQSSNLSFDTFTFEVFRSIGHDNPDSLENRLAGVALIPGAGEFVYATQAVFEDDGSGGSIAQNVHGVSGEADMLASLSRLSAENGMTLLAQNLVKGVVLLAAVIADSFLNPRNEETAQQGDI